MTININSAKKIIENLKKEEKKMNEGVSDVQERNLEKTDVIIDEMTVPIKNPEVTIRDEMEEDGKYLLFNAENELILVINSTGKFILDNCDGEKNVRELIQMINNEFSIKKDIDLTLVIKDYVELLYMASLIKIG